MVKQDDEKKFNRRIGRRLRELRTARGMTQMQLSEEMGVTYQQIQKYETGFNVASPWKLARLAEILGVPLTNFFEAAGVAPKKGEGHHTRMMAIMRRLQRIDRDNPEAFRAICDLAKALDPKEN
jgi:transcriptional regulator with XRE-family HTH domain